MNQMCECSFLYLRLSVLQIVWVSVCVFVLCYVLFLEWFLTPLIVFLTIIFKEVLA